MPRPKAPPTPSASTEPATTDRTDREVETSFTLPPPAVNRKATPPPSPMHRALPATSPRYKRTLSGATKSKEDLAIPQYDLPPPPSRARKIIQMKPKISPSASSSEASQLATSPPAKTTKRKQPSATSVAGRKIARKTAHSIIERRRRSKMNEEFGVLKDMIPACEGVEMHKLAILQAGIEYVRYLQECIKKLHGEREAQHHADDVDEEEQEEDSVPLKRTATESTTDWQHRKTSTNSNSTDPSPHLRPQLGSTSHHPALSGAQRFSASPAMGPYSSATPTPTLLSPAFNAIHFSPDLIRRGTTSSGTASTLVGASPNLLPQPHMSLDRKDNTSPANMSEGGAEATATAALMMLTTDRRGTSEIKRSGGMSVRDLLTP